MAGLLIEEFVLEFGHGSPEGRKNPAHRNQEGTKAKTALGITVRSALQQRRFRTSTFSVRETAKPSTPVDKGSGSRGLRVYAVHLRGQGSSSERSH